MVDTNFPGSASSALVAWRSGGSVDPEIERVARQRKESALLDLGTEYSVVASWLYTKCHHHLCTTAVPTAAVTTSGDGICALLYNPYFFAELDLPDVVFVLFHEARHLIHRHLYVDEELRADPVFTVAAEVSINHATLTRLRRDSLPLRNAGPEREAVGVDPHTVYQEYVADLQHNGLAPLPYDEFVATDLTVFEELKRMSRPPQVPATACVHLGEGEGRPGDGVIRLDQDATDELVTASLHEVVRAALRGDAQARDEVLVLADRSGVVSARASRIWGRLGLGLLRGVTAHTPTVAWWHQWLVDVLATKLADDERLVYPKKQGAVLLALGHEPFLRRRGPQRTKVVLIALDASGSIPDSVVTWMSRLVGRIDGVESHWLSFDSDLHPFVPGEPVGGGGGTDFQNVVDYVEGRREVAGRRFVHSPDAVIMLTDGDADHVTPAEPDKWIWLITRNGDDWPERHRPPMACHRLSKRSERRG